MDQMKKLEAKMKNKEKSFPERYFRVYTFLPLNYTLDFLRTPQNLFSEKQIERQYTSANWFSRPEENSEKQLINQSVTLCGLIYIH